VRNRDRGRNRTEYKEREKLEGRGGEEMEKKKEKGQEKEKVDRKDPCPHSHALYLICLLYFQSLVVQGLNNISSASTLYLLLANFLNP
jgi:hypothetical protein